MLFWKFKIKTEKDLPLTISLSVNWLIGINLVVLLPSQFNSILCFLEHGKLQERIFNKQKCTSIRFGNANGTLPRTWDKYIWKHLLCKLHKKLQVIQFFPLHFIFFFCWVLFFCFKFLLLFHAECKICSVFDLKCGVSSFSLSSSQS